MVVLSSIIFSVIKKIRLRIWQMQGTLLRIQGAEIHPSVKFYGKIFVVGDPKNIKIGKNCRLNQGVFINARDRIIIEEGVHISPYSQIHTGALDFKTKKHIKKPVLIKKNAWIASGVIISPGVTIGENAVIGANSTVISDVEPDSFYGGVPAKHIRKI